MDAPRTAVLALAGRRIDAPDSETARFPIDAVPAVRRAIASPFVQERVVALVCSAACGADLIALEVAELQAVRRRIVLPFPTAQFRETSVVDRPGDWGPMFDRLVAAAALAGDLLTINNGEDADAAYASANKRILSEAEAFTEPLAQSGERMRRLIACVVWEGEARQGTDATAGFRDLALEAGFQIRCVHTI
jgi:hypothetical protein